jgi:hypothetical protein
MTARPPEGATFEVSRIERTRSGAPLGALLWAAAPRSRRPRGRRTHQEMSMKTFFVAG